MSLGSQGIKIDYSKITKSIQYQFLKIVSEPTNELSFLNLYVDTEQNFLKVQDQIVPNAVYVVIHYGEASTDFASSFCSVSLSVLGTENRIEPTRKLLSIFAKQYNMQNALISSTVTDNSLLQYWRTPSISSNFVETQTDFRNLFTLNGGYIISESLINFAIDGITYYYTENNVEKEEKIDYIHYNQDCSLSVDPQPFYTSGGFTVSENRFGSFTFGFSTYLMNKHLINDVLGIQGFVKEGTNASSNMSVNNTFKFTLTFKETTTGTSYTKTESFKLAKCSISHNRGEVSSLSLTFTM